MSVSDSLDKQIILLLGQNAQQNSETLARQLNISSATVRRRVRKLIRSDLLRIIGVVDPANLGFPLAVLIVIDVDQHKIESVMDALVKRPEVGWASTTTGRFDIVIVAWFSSNDRLADYLKNVLGQMEGVRDSETLVCLEVKKGGYVPFLGF